MGGDNGGRREKGEGLSETCIKDPWTKPNGGLDQGWEMGMAGVEGSDGEKWRQLCLNNNKKKCEKIVCAF